MSRQAVILFSGGVDSTYVAAKCAPDYEKLVCITYKVPGMINVEFSSKSAAQLKKLFGDKIAHEIIDISEFVMFVRGGISRCIKDNLKYGYYYSWCMGCKLAMLLHTIKYCKAAGITTVLDGSNNYDLHALEQHACTKELFAELYRKAGIEFSSPCYYEKDLVVSTRAMDAVKRHLSLYKDSTEMRVVFLKEKGINVGKGFGSQYRSVQPSCVTSLLFNFPRVMLKTVRQEKPETFLAYINDKYQEYMSKTGQQSGARS
jgi:7-cyano-7-deazaguanine synthase in queuosine biosynthesis